MNNSTQTAQTTNTSDNSETNEADLEKRIAKLNATMKPVDEDRFRKNGQTWDEAVSGNSKVVNKQEEVLARAKTELGSQGLQPDPLDTRAIVAVNEQNEAPKPVEDVVAQVKASVYGNELNNVGGQATQKGVEAVVNELGVDDASRVKQLTLDGHIEDAAEVVKDATPSGQNNAEQARLDIEAALAGGETLSGEQQKTAEILDIETQEQSESNDIDTKIKGLEEQMSALQDKMSAGDFSAVDLTALKEAQEEWFKMKTEKTLPMNGTNQSFNASRAAEKSADIASALKRATEMAELATKQAEQEALPKAA
jgi:hypothetical protein